MSLDPNEFRKITVDVLAKRAGQICSNPDCKKHTSLAHSDPSKFIILGEAAHISGQKPSTARYNPKLTPEERRHASNGIWLCRDCHKIVDADENKFPLELLKKWKEEHEESIQTSRGLTDKDLMQEVVRETLKSLGIVSENVPPVSIEALEDDNIKLSFVQWSKGNINEAIIASKRAYTSKDGPVRLQAIVNILLLTDEIKENAYLIALSQEGIVLALKLGYLSTAAVIKSHKARLLQHRIVEKSIKIQYEIKLREATIFSTMSDATIRSLLEGSKKDAEEIMQLFQEAQDEAIKAKDQEALAHIKMTMASTQGSMYNLVHYMGGNSGEIKHFVIKVYNEVLDYYTKTHNKEGQGYVLHNLANNLRFFGEKKLAKEYTLRVIKLAKEIKNKELENKAKELLTRL